MNREEKTDLGDARRAIVHRIATHRAALNTAQALGWPHVLSDAVAETRARLEESQACLEAVDVATGAACHG